MEEKSRRVVRKIILGSICRNKILNTFTVREIHEIGESILINLEEQGYKVVKDGTQ